MKKLRRKTFKNGVVYCLQLEDGFLVETTDTILPYYTKDAIGRHQNKLDNNFLEDQEAKKQTALAQETASQEINATKTQTSMAKVESDSVIERTRLEKAAELEKLKELQKVEISKASEKAKEAEINATVILETKKKNEKAELEAKAKKNISKINAEAQNEK